MDFISFSLKIDRKKTLKFKIFRLILFFFHMTYSYLESLEIYVIEIVILSCTSNHESIYKIFKIYGG